MDVPPDVAIEIERQKLAIDERRIANEERQAKGWRAVVPGLTIVAPVVIALFTLAYQIYESNEQGERDFELAAAEIVMSSETPIGTHNKARALNALFPERLPEDFADSFDPSQFATQSMEQARLTGLENRLLERPAEARQILRVWIAFHPEDEARAREILERLDESG